MKFMIKVLLVLGLSNIVYASDIGIYFAKSVKKVYRNNTDIIESMLKIQLENFQAQNKLISIEKDGFERSLMRGNKNFLKTIAKEQKLDAILVLKYKKITNSVKVECYVSSTGAQVTEFSFVGKTYSKKALVTTILQTLSEISFIDIDKKRI